MAANRLAAHAPKLCRSGGRLSLRAAPTPCGPSQFLLGAARRCRLMCTSSRRSSSPSAPTDSLWPPSAHGRQTSTHFERAATRTDSTAAMRAHRSTTVHDCCEYSVVTSPAALCMHARHAAHTEEHGYRTQSRVATSCFRCVALRMLCCRCHRYSVRLGIVTEMPPSLVRGSDEIALQGGIISTDQREVRP